jgi:hypothetical protein
LPWIESGLLTSLLGIALDTTFRYCRRRLRRFRLNFDLGWLLDKLHPAFARRLVGSAARAAQRDNMSRSVTPGIADRTLPVPA